MGRRKITIAKIENRAARNVAFSKRRAGAFKKAAELCELTGAKIFIIAMSPGGKPYVFGHPDADSVINRFLGEIAVDAHSCGVVPLVCGESSGTQTVDPVATVEDMVLNQFDSAAGVPGLANTPSRGDAESTAALEEDYTRDLDALSIPDVSYFGVNLENLDFGFDLEEEQLGLDYFGI